ncbi:MAG: adenylate/guanylate cyclase domain-containing protein [Gammaproteobacteria bacterium]|nr:adenylate/guanylate cyclase domain-containing protein [Gammaproteobacteria bacterium]MCP5196859.1 adenylate/guanylate cyclase domain-containing protein [Gammaproteobacteria bacterium]
MKLSGQTPGCRVAWAREQHAPLVCLLLGHLVFGGVLLLWNLGALQNLELIAYDQALRWRSPPPPDERIVLIGETEADIQRWGHPLPDGILADLLERLLQGRPQVIGVDKYRDLPAPPGSERLNQLLREHPEIIWVMKFGNPAAGEPAIAPPAVLAHSDRIGFSDVPLDLDGLVRRGLLFLDDGQQFATAFPLSVALRYLQAKGIGLQPDPHNADWLRLGATTLPPLTTDTGGYIHLDAGGYQYLLDFRGRIDPTQIYSVTDVLAGWVPAARWTDKIILLGSMAVSLRDDFQVPVRYSPAKGIHSPQPIDEATGRIAGITLHGLQINQLLRFALAGDRPLHGLPDHLETGWLWVGCLIGVGLALCQLHFRWLLMLMAGALTLLTGLWQIAFTQQLWLPWVAPALGLTSAAALCSVYRSVYERTEKRLMMNLFARHVAPEVAETLWRERQHFLEDGRLRSQRLTATVLFTDIQGFTTLAENLEPAQLMDWLNRYMEAMSEVVMTHGGVINKYIGDAVMALFGVPTPRQIEAEIAADATRAVTCALAMGERLRQLNADWAQQGLPVIAMRVGIQTGPLVAGSLGSRRRLEYTVLGDTVNSASRLESFEKDAHHTVGSVCRVLIGETTFHYLNRNISSLSHALIGETLYHDLDDRLRITEVSRVHLKGKQQAIAVYRVERITQND